MILFEAIISGSTRRRERAAHHHQNSCRCPRQSERPAARVGFENLAEDLRLLTALGSSQFR